MGKIFLIRHGRTVWNEERRCQGITDIPLSQEGIEEARRLRERLRDERIDIAFSSPLKRALETARIILDGRDIELIIREELRELDFGRFEGMIFREALEKFPDIAEKWANHSPDVKFPGGEGIEDIHKRLKPVAEELASLNKTALVVSHGGVIRSILCHILNLPLERWFEFKIDPASISIVGDTGVIIGDTSHLR